MILLPFLFAFLYRCRGGFLGLGSTQLARLLYWVLPWAVFSVSILTLNEPFKINSLFFGFLSGVGSFLGMLIPHGKWMGCKTWKDTLMMCAIGAARGLLIAAPLLWLKPAAALIILGGALSGLGYWLGSRCASGLVMRWKGQVFVDGIEGQQEVLAGFCYGLGAMACLALM